MSLKQMSHQTFIFHVHGMHCNSCVILTESELRNHKLVEHAVADLKSCCVEVRGDFDGRNGKDIAKELSPLLEKHGYKLSLEKEVKQTNWSDFNIAVPIALGFVALFIVLQKIGLVNLVGGSDVTFGTAFLIGLIASVSTCMAIVGGLILSVSSNYAKEGDKVKPQLYFHVGRLASFFILGGVIGALGSAFQLGINGTFILGIVVALVMLILGLNLLDVFSWAKKLQPTMPKFISNHILGIKKINHTLTPLLLGMATFFLPCGFTQSMQLFTLTTGSFINGALTMLIFAIGTFPVLALLSFGSVGIHDKFKSGIFFKTAGLVVIFFALFNIFNSFAAIGVLPPLFSF